MLCCPQIEPHLDDFLRRRLGKKMRMIRMFVGENTIRQLKDGFMEELKGHSGGNDVAYHGRIPVKDVCRSCCGENEPCPNAGSVNNITCAYHP